MVALLTVMPPSDWLVLVRSAPLRPVILPWCLRCAPCACSVTVPVFHFIFALVWAPLQWHVNLRSLFRGSAFGLYQPSWQGIQLCALLRQNPDDDLAWSYGGASRQRSGSPNAPGSMPQALRWQRSSFTFAGVNFCGFNIPRVGV